MDRITPETARAKLADVPEPFFRVFEHESLEVEIYQPVDIDRQTPHSRDEIYIVISGGGEFVNNGIRHRFQPGEVIFVPAGVEHRFENFTEDFATWVIFFGPNKL